MKTSFKEAVVHNAVKLTGILLANLAWIPTAPAATTYVWPDSPSPALPYGTWATAAHTIQEAVDAATAGEEIVVTNGVYATGGRAVFGIMTNRVAVNKPVLVRSVNGAQVTTIQGRQAPGGGIGAGAIRCVYLAEGAVLSGFTLTNGATSGSGTDVPERSGGGVLCASTNALVSHCTLVSNAASFGGGGACSGTLSNCALLGNRSFDGGSAYESILKNCVLTGNSAYRDGGGAARARLHNCTITGNSAGRGGGIAGCQLVNCIVYYNTATTSAEANHAQSANGGSSLDYACTTPLPQSGKLNFTNAPLFVDSVSGDLRLQPGSPCIGAGDNAFAPGDTDFDGQPRIAWLRVDVGAYEHQGPGLSPYATWLQQHGLPVDGSADFTDPDHDQANNWQEWGAGTDPANALSVLRVEFASPGTVRFLSLPDRLYTLRYADSLFEYESLAPWFDVPGQTDIPGTGGWQSLTDPNTSALRFYRVSVRKP
jgi:hypothetical protein